MTYSQKIEKNFFCVTVFSFMILILISAFSSSYGRPSILSTQYPANAMWIEPSSIKTSFGEKFNITIWINLTQESFAWQIKLDFNISYFQALRTGYTNGTKSSFFSEYSTIPIDPIINNNEGFILHGETLIGNEERIAGYGSLIWIEFNQTDIPPQNRFNLNFSSPYGEDTFILTPYLEIIPINTLMGVNISVAVNPPLLSYIIIIGIIIIITATAVTIFVVRGKRRRKKHNENKN